MSRWLSAISLAAIMALTATAGHAADENGFSNLLQGIIGSDSKDAASKPSMVQTNSDTKTDETTKDLAGAPLSFEPMPFAVLRTLDKVTARAKTIQVKTDEPFKVGNLVVVVKACRQRPPEEPPESAAFLQVVEEKTSEHQVKNLFSGWMFASSPGLSALEHPIYDIWLVKCAAPAAPKAVTENPPAPPAKDAKSSDNKPAKPAAKASGKTAGKAVTLPIH